MLGTKKKSPGAMSGELRDSGTGFSLDWILVKPGSTALLLLTSLSEMSCTSSWSLSDLEHKYFCRIMANIFHHLQLKLLRSHVLESFPLGFEQKDNSFCMMNSDKVRYFWWKSVLWERYDKRKLFTIRTRMRAENKRRECSLVLFRTICLFK